MEYIIGLIIVLAIVSAAKTRLDAKKNTGVSPKIKAAYAFARKDALMTAAETAFYHRLETVAGDRYYIFPQIHLSALLTNQTKGRYWKAAFQRINRTSVDYVLCDKQTMRPVYAVELDDSTHDTAKRQARDAGVEEMLANVGLPLVRFRDVGHMSDEQIIDMFASAHEQRAAA